MFDISINRMTEDAYNPDRVYGTVTILTEEREKSSCSFVCDRNTSEISLYGSIFQPFLDPIFQNRKAVENTILSWCRELQPGEIRASFI